MSYVARRTSLLFALCMATAMTARAQAPAPAGATMSRTTGIVFGGNLAGMSLSTTESNTTETESGAGGGALLGWGFTPLITGLVRYNQAAIAIANSDGSYTLGQFDIGARFHFRKETNRARPYLEGFVTGRAIQFTVSDNVSSETLRANGGGLTAGGGVQIHFSPAVAFDVGLDVTTGDFGDWELNGQTVSDVGSIGATGGLFRLGLAFWPMAGARQ